jgi:CRISPR-associated endonuclease/helicase Cas3
VAEVGRDHDYDWAIVEPSSIRSIIQLAGRVRRHRAGPVEGDNILLLNRNIKALQRKHPAYCRPGFESEHLRLDTTALDELLCGSQVTPLNAAPRIAERPILEPSHNLADLEHQRLRSLMLSSAARSSTYTVPDWWTTPAWMTGVLQRSQRFRAGAPEETFALIPSDDESSLDFSRLDEDWTVTNSLLTELSLSVGPRIEAWGPRHYTNTLERLAEQLDMDLQRCARRFGTVQLRESTQGWAYHPALGFKTLS